MTAVVVIGDVHGNARALHAALAVARNGPLDELVFIGDLLTYGHDVDEVLDLVAEAQARHGATVLIGNHDQLYFDLAEGDRTYIDTLPAWIRASVEHTVGMVGSSLRARLRWSEQVVRDGVLFAHANPFGFRNWTYLNRVEDVARAQAALESQGLRAGVFGHTHRPRWCMDVPARDRVMTWSGPHALVLNVGSVGQPRDGTSRSVIARLDIETLSATFEAVDYDVAAHVAALHASGLGATTVAKLAAFFAGVESDHEYGDA